VSVEWFWDVFYVYCVLFLFEIRVLISALLVVRMYRRLGLGLEGFWGDCRRGPCGWGLALGSGWGRREEWEGESLSGLLDGFVLPKLLVLRLIRFLDTFIRLSFFGRLTLMIRLTFVFALLIIIREIKFGVIKAKYFLIFLLHRNINMKQYIKADWEYIYN